MNDWLANSIDDLDNLYERIKAIPSADKWIPVSERLPEEDGCYLVTTTGTNNDIIDIAHYTEGIWHKASRIKAWMPLPSPYIEGSSTITFSTDGMVYDKLTTDDGDPDGTGGQIFCP